MRCRKVRKLISARADGELDEGRRGAVDRHLGGCEGCRAFADDVGRLADELGLAEAPEARWGFTDRVLARLSQEEPAGVRRPGLFDLLRPAPLGVGAVAFCLGVGATFLMNGVNGEFGVDGAMEDPAVEELVGDYATVLAEASIQGHLSTLFPETED